MITFNIPSKIILNSNSMPNQWFIKSSRAAEIRALAQSKGVAEHSDPKSAKQELEYNIARSELTAAKGREHKKMKKEGFTANEIEVELEAMEKRALIPEPPEHLNYMFKKFEINVKVYSPTRRKLDPPNLYPTVKPLIDGLTDCGWWEDDNHEHLKKVSFEYGGLSGEKGTFKIELSIKEVT